MNLKRIGKSAGSHMQIVHVNSYDIHNGLYIIQGYGDVFAAFGLAWCLGVL